MFGTHNQSAHSLTTNTLLQARSLIKSSQINNKRSAVTVVKTVTNFVKEEFFPELVIDTTSLENKANDLHKTIENLFKSEKQNASAFSSMYG